MDPVAVIETEDGARVRLGRSWIRSGIGRGEAHLDGRRDAVVRESEHERYRWLDNALGVWEGEFGAEAHSARYQAYLVKDDASGVGG